MSDMPPPAPRPLSDSDARLYATLSHVGVIVAGFLPPLIFWLIGKDRSAFVDDQGKEALNFSILITMLYVIGGILSVIFVGLLVLFGAWVLSLVFCIQGAIAANKGERYRYPLNWRVIK